MVRRAHLAFLCTFAIACRASGTAAISPTPAATPTPRVAAEVPREIGAYRLEDTRRLPDPTGARGSGGTAHRYRDTSAVWLTVILYTVPTDSVKASWSGPMRVQAEADNFLQLMPIQVRRGVYTSYKPMVTRPDSVVVGSTAIPGHYAAVSVLREGRAYVEQQFLYLIGDTFVKIRASVPEASWPRSDLPAFASSLVSALTIP